MKRLFLFMLIILISQPLFADETFLCTFGQKEREISLIYTNPEKPLPCEVRYKKEGVTKILWYSKNTEGYCEEKTEDFINKQINWGWRCQNVSSNSAMVGIPLQPDAASHYKRKAYFAQAIAAVAPFKLSVVEHYMSHGQYPESLQALGINPAEMKTSSYFSDLILGKNGALYIQGNERIGVNTTIRLQPVSTLGGAGIEWRCTTNVQRPVVDYCEYADNLNF